jgi:hypothetical protein
MNLVFFVLLVSIRATTTSPFLDFWNHNLVDSVYIPRREPTIQTLLAENAIDEAIQLAANQAMTTAAYPIYSDVSALMVAQKARIDTLREDCLRMSRLVTGSGRAEISRRRMESELGLTRRSLWVLCQQTFSLLLHLIEIRRFSSDTELVDYHIGVGNFIRYAIEQQYPDPDIGREALMHYDLAIQLTQDMTTLLNAKNHKGLLLKHIEGETAAARYLEYEIRVSNAQIDQLYLGGRISADDAIFLTDIVSMMSHNVSIWRDPEDWVIV